MDFDALTNNIRAAQDVLQQQAVHAVNMALTTRNWLIGYYIVEYEQNGEDRAAYGASLLQKLEERLHNKGMTVRRFREYRRLYKTYPQFGQPIFQYLSAHGAIRHTSCAELAGSIRRLLTAGLDNGPIRRTVSAEFETQDNQHDKWMIPADKLFNSEALSALVRQQAMPLTPKDVINAPMALEFLGLDARPVMREGDLEQAILDNIQAFLLEMGQGFCFEARQKRILVDEDYFSIDLVFYHRILKCHVIVELKTDRFRHEYASQLNLYLNYYKSEVMQPDDNPPIGLLLCTDHGETIVKYATAGLDPNLFVRKYLVKLPPEEEIKAYLAKNI